jgi:hypothetical protein
MRPAQAAGLAKGFEKEHGVAKIAVQQDIGLGCDAADLVAIAGDDEPCLIGDWRERF